METSAAGLLRIAGVVDTYAAAALYSQLGRLIEEQAAPAVDLSGVESCDFTAIQLLCAARRSAERAGKPFSVTALSEGVSRTCAVLGLSPEILSGPGSE
jgi:anti-anti-sigma factor